MDNEMLLVAADRLHSIIERGRRCADKSGNRLFTVTIEEIENAFMDMLKIIENNKEWNNNKTNIEGGENIEEYSRK